jgi:hypothetical protein
MTASASALIVANGSQTATAIVGQIANDYAAAAAFAGCLSCNPLQTVNRHDGALCAFCDYLGTVDPAALDPYLRTGQTIRSPAE